MRRFELTLPSTVSDCLAALSDGGRRRQDGCWRHRPAAADEERPGQAGPRRRPERRARAEASRSRRDGALHIGAAVTARAVELSHGPCATGSWRWLRARAWSARFRSATWPRSAATSATRRRRPTCRRRWWRWTPWSSSPGPDGQRLLPIADFFQGVRRTALEPGELLVEIVVPAPAPAAAAPTCATRRAASSTSPWWASASQLTIRDGRCTKARIALGAVAPVIVRATEAEASLEGQEVTPELIDEAATLAVGAASPISDQRGSAEYRLHLVRVLTRRTLTTAFERATGRSASRNGAH